MSREGEHVTDRNKNGDVRFAPWEKKVTKGGVKGVMELRSMLLLTVRGISRCVMMVYSMYGASNQTNIFNLDFSVRLSVGRTDGWRKR